MDRPYFIISLEQGTREWLDWRNGGIGGSDASTIMGENRFESAAGLLAQKCGPAMAGRMNAAMARGVALEPEARAFYNKTLSVISEPQCVQSLEYEWLRASLDGITPDGSRAVEIKCGRSAYETTARTGCPPGYYYGQFQHLMAVTGLNSIDYCCYFPPGRPIITTVERNQSYIDDLLRKEEAFWKRVLEKRSV
ncbi:MAG: YqaJ viral recombinase family protein [Verrucomicrobiae bacterium]|nr:YqaJ viral recombinase family protein [Verrucomicrobiae bacterium]